MQGRIIDNEADLDEGAAWLVQREPLFARVVQATGLPPLRRRPDGFEALLDAVVSQQLSVAAADTIWSRMEAIGATRPAGLAALADQDLRLCGLSRAKIGYARGLAAADLDFDALRRLSDAEVVARLVELKGIGPWTAEIYAMFSLGRADVFAPGDLALQEGWRLLSGIEDRPTERELRRIAEAWSPWRAVAARLLWAWYRVARQREGVKA